MTGRKRRSVGQKVPSLTIALPLDDEQATAIVIAADRFDVEPWEMAVHVLQARRWFE